MKKILAIMLVSLLVLTGCGSKDKGNDTNGGTGKEGKTFNIGTAVHTTESSQDEEEEEGKFEVNTYYATVVMDGDKFVDVNIDTAQNTVFVNAQDEYTKFEGKGTKKEQGDGYGMKEIAKAVGEWYEQI